MKAGAAAVAAIQEALDRLGIELTMSDCQAAADAAAPHNAAQALREAASAWQSGEGFTVMTPRGVGIPAIDYAQRALDWLSDRADRMQAGQ